MRLVIFFILILLGGCTSLNEASIPFQMVGGYFGHLAAHEYAHVHTAHSLGARDIEVSLLPSRVNGKFRFGNILYTGNDVSERDMSRISMAGPIGSFASSAFSRSVLRTGLVPRELQPLFGWMDVFGRISCYFHAATGILQVGDTDLAKQDVWVAVAFLSINVVYDVVSWILSDETPERYFGVLVGRNYYDME